MSVTVLPRYPIPGYEDMSPEEAAELLHQEKNRPEGPPTAVLRRYTRPYSELSADEKAYPAAVYREWRDADRNMARYRAAARLNMSLNNPLEAEQVDAFIGAFDSKNVRNVAEMDQAMADGWAKTPNEARENAFHAHRQVATDAALSHYDDRYLSDAARAHHEAVEDAADDHVTEVPRTPIPAHQKKVR